MLDYHGRYTNSVFYNIQMCILFLFNLFIIPIIVVGIWRDSGCVSTPLAHAMLLVGYTEQYIRVRNRLQLCTVYQIFCFLWILSHFTSAKFCWFQTPPPASLGGQRFLSFFRKIILDLNTKQQQKTRFLNILMCFRIFLNFFQKSFST